MIFNRWRKHPKRKPKVSGYYLCTTKEQMSRVDCGYADRFILHYDVRKDKWIDISRQSVFDGYVVYKVCRAPIEENHVYSDGLCERDDVLAWKKLPKKWGATYYVSRKKGND